MALPQLHNGFYNQKKIILPLINFIYYRYVVFILIGPFLFHNLYIDRSVSINNY